jgi:hypothetical protein
MNRLKVLVVLFVVLGTTSLFGQQVQDAKPSDTPKSVEEAKPTAEESPKPVRRTYRSYSVSPSTRTTMSSRGYHASHATWRHSDSKATGQFRSGR